jgi:hypothetical protein
MPEGERITFTYQEVVTALLKHHGIHEERWSISLTFGLGTAVTSACCDDDEFPTAVVPVLEIGIHRDGKVNNLSVDASKVNPSNS